MKKGLIYLTLTAALGLAGAGVVYELARKESNQEQNLEQITFEQAKLNPSLRQQYLDQILENKNKLGDYLWNSFERLVYDSNFEKSQKYAEEFGLEIEPPITNGVSLALTHDIRKLKGKKQVSFFSKKCFFGGAVKNEDDLLSCIDNESFHAYFTENNLFPNYITTNNFKYKFTKKESYLVQRLVLEAISFDVQFYKIAKGQRKVSDRFEQGTGKSFLEVYKKLQEISKQNNNDSEFAKAILNVLRCRPDVK